MAEGGPSPKNERPILTDEVGDIDLESLTESSSFEGINFRKEKCSKERPIDPSFNPGLKEPSMLRRGKPTKSPSPQQLSPNAAYDAGLKLRTKAKMSDFNSNEFLAPSTMRPEIRSPEEQANQFTPVSNTSLDASPSKIFPLSQKSLKDHNLYIKGVTGKLTSPGKQKFTSASLQLTPIQITPSCRSKVLISGKEQIPVFNVSPHHKLPSASAYLDMSPSRAFTPSFLPKVHNLDDINPHDIPEQMVKRGKQRHTSLPPLPTMKRVALPTKSPPTSPSASMSPAGSPTRMQRMKRAVLTKLKALPSVKIQVEKAPQRGVVDTALLTRWHKLPKALKVKCKPLGLPILYSRRYDVKLPLRMRLQHYSILWDKPSRVMSTVAKKLAKLAPGYTCIMWHAVDVSTVFDIIEAEPALIRKCDVIEVVKMMDLDLYTKFSLPSWDKFDALILHSLRVQMMGSLVACKLAMDQGWAINIGGGFGHHTTNNGGGLAVYDDVLLCLSILTTLLNATQILIINLDAYQSPCYKHVKKIDCPVTIIDLYSEPINDEHDCTVINSYVSYHGHQVVSNDHYLTLLEKLIEDCFEKPGFQPSLCIYLAGTTVLCNNVHTSINLSIKNVIERDYVVFDSMHHHTIPIALLLGNGYQHYDVKASAYSIINLWEKGRLQKWPHKKAVDPY